LLPADAFVFGDEIGRRVTTFKNAWQVTLLKAYGHEPEWQKGRLSAKCREQIRQIDLHFHDLRHEVGSRWLEGRIPIHHMKELLGHANIKTTDTYLNATRIGRQKSMKKFEESRKGCTNVAQTHERDAEKEEVEEGSMGEEVSLPPDVIIGGPSGTSFATGSSKPRDHLHCLALGSTCPALPCRRSTCGHPIGQARFGL